ncbi:MAG: hypothetical protein ACT4OS_05495 [Acidimicrobiales bacterium]
MTPPRRSHAEADPIPDQVRRLLDRSLTSVSEVEALVLLVRNPRRWTAREVARQFVLAEDHAAALLDALVRARLVRVQGAEYEFAPADGKDRQAADQLATIYDTYRLRIMSILLSKPSDAIRDFADAFRIRSSKEEGD